MLLVFSQFITIRLHWEVRSHRLCETGGPGSGSVIIFLADPDLTSGHPISGSQTKSHQYALFKDVDGFENFDY